MKSALEIGFKFTPVYEVIYAINEAGIIKKVSQSFMDCKGNLCYQEHKMISSQFDPRTNYLAVDLTGVDGSMERHFVHHLLARTFVSNPSQKSIVRHKNGIIWDNRLNNLEWVSLNLDTIPA